MLGPLQQQLTDQMIGRKAQEEARAKAAANKAAENERNKAMMREQMRQEAEQQRLADLIAQRDEIAKRAYFEGMRTGSGVSDAEVMQKLTEPSLDEKMMSGEEMLGLNQGELMIDPQTGMQISAPQQPAIQAPVPPGYRQPKVDPRAIDSVGSLHKQNQQKMNPITAYAQRLLEE